MFLYLQNYVVFFYLVNISTRAEKRAKTQNRGPQTDIKGKRTAPSCNNAPVGGFFYCRKNFLKKYKKVLDSPRVAW